MRSYQSGDARLKMREILTAVEQGEPVELKRYETVTAIVIPPAWFELASDVLEMLGTALDRGALTAEEWAALRDHRARYASAWEARRVVGIKPQDARVVHHIDGDPLNNDPANLVVMDPKENKS